MRVELRIKREDPCHIIRLKRPADVLAAQGADVASIEGPILATFSDTVFRGRTLMTKTHDFDTDADVLVFPRLMDRTVVEQIPEMQRQGHAVVIEVDDDFEALPSGHPAKKISAPRWSPDNNRLWLKRACAMADLVTVSTPALAARYAPHGRVAVLRNCVPESYLSVKVERFGDTIGWTGYTANHIDDLRVTGGGIARALDAHPDWQFRHIGPQDETATQLGIPDDRVVTSGVADLDGYPLAYARLDVAIAPLQISPFNEAKSYLKVLEAAALGVPIVASPTSEYRRAHGEGLCQWAGLPPVWRHWVEILMDDDALRANIAATAREAAAPHTYEANAHLWMQAWEQARKNHLERRVA